MGRARGVFGQAKEWSELSDRKMTRAKRQTLVLQDYVPNKMKLLLVKLKPDIKAASFCSSFESQCKETKIESSNIGCEARMVECIEV